MTPGEGGTVFADPSNIHRAVQPAGGIKKAIFFSLGVSYKKFKKIESFLGGLP